MPSGLTVRQGREVEQRGETEERGDRRIDIEHLKNVHLTNGETNPPDRCPPRQMKHDRIVRLSWKKESEGEESG